MSKSIKNLLTVAVVFALVVTVAASVFAYIAMTGEFDHDIGHYKVGSVNAALGMYLPMAVPVFGIVMAFMLRKKVSFHRMPEANIPTIFASVLTGLLMIVSAVMTVVSGGEMSKITLWATVFAVISGAYFLLLSFFGDKGFMSVLAFAPPLWAAMELLEEYFREGGPINSPIRTANLTMLALLLLFFAEEIRFFIGRQITGVWYLCNLSALAFTGVAVFPKIAVIFSGNAGFGFEFLDWCLYAAVFMFLLARLSAAPAVLGEYIPPVKPAKKTKAPAPAESPAYASDEAEAPADDAVSEDSEGSSDE